MLTECLPTKMDALRALINQLSHYIVANGGKRLRPVLALLSALWHESAAQGALLRVQS